MVWNVADPFNQQRVGQVDTVGEIVGFEAVNGRLVLVTSKQPWSWIPDRPGLDVFGINEDLKLPQRLAFLPLPGEPRFLRMVGNLAVVGYWDRLILVDVSDGRSPQIVGQLEGLQGAVSAEVFGRFLVLKLSRGECELIDLSDPQRPARSGFLEGATDFSQIRIFGDRIYLIGGPTGNLVRCLTLRSGIKQKISWTVPFEPFIPLNEPRPLRAVSSSGLPVVLRIGAGPGSIVENTLIVSQFTEPVLVIAEQDGDGDFLPARIERLVNDRPAGRISAPTGAYQLGGMEVGDSVPLYRGHVAGIPVSHRVLSGPGVIQGDRLIALGPGTVLLQTSAPGNDDFLPMEFNQAIAIGELFLQSRLAEDGRQLTLTWLSKSSILETSQTGLDGWTPVEAAQSPFVASSEGRQQFFRLRRP